MLKRLTDADHTTRCCRVGVKVRNTVKVREKVGYRGAPHFLNKRSIPLAKTEYIITDDVVKYRLT